MAAMRGTAHRFGADVDTDLIIPARYLTTSDPAELAKHAMEDADPEFVKKVKRGDFIVAGKNFGCGSSREHAPIAIREAGVACVIAKSYARIFYRNAFNTGLPILESAEAVEATLSGHELEVDVETGRIMNLTTGQRFEARPIPPFMMEILKDGGLMPHVMKKRAAAK